MRKTLFILFCSLLVTILAAHPAFANGTTFFRYSKMPTGQVLPMEPGKMSIEGEELSIRFVKQNKGTIFAPDHPSMKARIQVIYKLHNHLSEDWEVPIAFPHPGETDQWKVTFDGKTIPLTGTVMLPREQVVGKVPLHSWIHPRIGKKYELSYQDEYAEFRSIPSQTFTVLAKGETTHTLQIEYEASLGIDERTNLHPVYRFDYLLHPASYWSDFKDLHIKLDIPFNGDVYVNLPLQKSGFYSWEGTFDRLPEEDLVVFLSPDSGVVIDLFHSRAAALAAVPILLLLFYPIGRWMISRTPSRHGKVVSILWLAVCLWAGYDILEMNITGYPFKVLQPVLFGVYVLILILVWNRLRRV
ncbi:DUF4424 domain-containing protein [Brevibacillus humidisoli]|uniref:DUF4424 domain-containing protein n=1 Tax=Brevibacillus humidisoli TaxID=2895522 RepID=UPI001E4557A2|nr:DUF4424 domain-containing protein [Brevibacillus humidisoli]UFJ40313.1 DUF4424 domain-containing protein [Brevibacillus humidisoli]